MSSSSSIEEQLHDAVFGTGDKQIAKCDKCNREYPNVEPDAQFDCKAKDCNGRVKSDLVRNGFI